MPQKTVSVPAYVTWSLASLSPQEASWSLEHSLSCSRQHNPNGLSVRPITTAIFHTYLRAVSDAGVHDTHMTCSLAPRTQMEK